MPKIELTITISVILALAAIISPIFTAIINNRYQLKLKKLELKQKNTSKPSCIKEIFLKTIFVT